MFLIETIKEDWSYRLPERLKYNRYRGTNRICYQFLCLLYYPIKTLLLLLLSVYYYIFYGLYLILKYFFDRNTYYDDFEADYYDDEVTEDETIYDDVENTEPENSALKLLWYLGSENDWKQALNHYNYILGDKQRILEDYINNINVDIIQTMNINEFYEFLYNKYFVWKFTEYLPNRRKDLEKYIREDNLEELLNIKDEIFSTSHTDIEKCLITAQKIHGLGTAGASGLLAILFPEDFGTVDQFVVKRLCEIDHPIYKSFLDEMKPKSLNIKDGVVLIKIMREKANELNQQFNTDFWTPRKIDMILWSYGR